MSSRLFLPFFFYFIRNINILLKVTITFDHPIFHQVILNKMYYLYNERFFIAHHYYMYYLSIVNIHNVVYAIHQMKSSIVSIVWISIFTCIFVIATVLLLHTKPVLIKRTFQKVLRTKGNQFYYDILYDEECRAISSHHTSNICLQFDRMLI